MDHIFFIRSSVDGRLDCFHVLALVNSAAENVGVHVSFWIRFFSGNMPRSGIAGSHGSSIFSSIRNLHSVLHSGFISLRSHQQCRKIPFPPHPLHHLPCVDFVMMAILTSVSWYFLVVLIYISLIINDVECLSMCLTICMSSLEKCLFRSSTHFLIRLFFLIWRCMSCFFIWRIILCQLLC